MRCPGKVRALTSYFPAPSAYAPPSAFESHLTFSPGLLATSRLALAFLVTIVLAEMALLRVRLPAAAIAFGVIAKGSPRERLAPCEVLKVANSISASLPLRFGIRSVSTDRDITAHASFPIQLRPSHSIFHADRAAFTTY
jgi:hypothetical protein